MFKKGDIAAKIVTTLTHYGFGSGRAATTHHSIEIIRVASATRDGRVKKYQTSMTSPAYQADVRYGREKYMTISGDAQLMAKRLFETAPDMRSLRFDSQEAAKAAILSMGA